MLGWMASVFGGEPCVDSEATDLKISSLSDRESKRTIATVFNCRMP
jgi:hypothetical protein